MSKRDVIDDVVEVRAQRKAKRKLAVVEVKEDRLLAELESELRELNGDQPLFGEDLDD